MPLEPNLTVKCDFSPTAIAILHHTSENMLRRGAMTRKYERIALELNGTAAKNTTAPELVIMIMESRFELNGFDLRSSDVGINTTLPNLRGTYDLNTARSNLNSNQLTSAPAWQASYARALRKNHNLRYSANGRPPSTALAPEFAQLSAIVRCAPSLAVAGTTTRSAAGPRPVARRRGAAARQKGHGRYRYCGIA